MQSVGERLAQGSEPRHTLRQAAMDRGLEAGRNGLRASGLTGDKAVGNVVDDALSGDLAASIKSNSAEFMKLRIAA